jgi:DNA adenine methylase
MFLDPPYDCVFNSYGNNDIPDGFNEAEQRRLAENFKNLS